jgi:MFS family permease
MDLARIGTLAAVYPAVWGIAQVITGCPIASAASSSSYGACGCRLPGSPRRSRAQVRRASQPAPLLGLGTALVYPTLLAAIGDVAQPEWRASAVGVYRLWRDLGYAIGALIAGITADWFGLSFAVWLAGITFLSGVIAAARDG